MAWVRGSESGKVHRMTGMGTNKPKRKTCARTDVRGVESIEIWVRVWGLILIQNSDVQNNLPMRRELREPKWEWECKHERCRSQNRRTKGSQERRRARNTNTEHRHEAEAKEKESPNEKRGLVLYSTTWYIRIIVCNNCKKKMPGWSRYES